MKATEELVHTHAVVLKLLEIFTVDNPRFGESIKTLRRAVEAHAWLQDEIFLPALKGKPMIEPRLVDELVQEHKSRKVPDPTEKRRALAGTQQNLRQVQQRGLFLWKGLLVKLP